MTREELREEFLGKAFECELRDHQNNYGRLYVSRSGEIFWGEEVSRASQLVDRDASDFRAVINYGPVGRGGTDCTCDFCEAVGEDWSLRDSIGQAAADNGLEVIEEKLAEIFDSIEPGYFNFESDATRRSA